MLLRKAYYMAKPLLPWRLRIALRRWHARSIRKTTSSWPIDTAAASPPAGWTGWPEGKRFALVLTHDVERRRGLERCRDLAAMEMRLGFRSSFNFVPEGEYKTPEELRREFVVNGFEVGVHDFRHDGKLFVSRSRFRQQAQGIRRYLKEWGAVGFRSGFMHHNLQWLHELGVMYDASTFDRDPFEWQPEGAGTIFPFWVPNPDAASGSGSGYVELPYTLTQDSTLFIVFRETSADIWKRKLDWIAEHGGMALLIAHPDYMKFDGGRCSSREYPAALYEEFLRHVRSDYAGQYWPALPQQVAEHVRRMRAGSSFPQVSVEQRPVQFVV